MSKFYYFSYGSNLSIERIRINNKSAQFFCVGHLKGFKLTFQTYSEFWKGATANIIKDEQSKVFGVIWTLDESDLQNLDKQELHYERIEVNVQKMNSDEFYKCWTYTQLKSPKQDIPTKPSLKYKNLVINGSKLNKFPEYYIKFLENIEDNGIMDCGPVQLN